MTATTTCPPKRVKVKPHVSATAADLPPIEVDHLVTPSPVTEGGIKGMGEGGLIGAPAAVVNAIADALEPFGVSIEQTPLRPSDVLALIDAAR